MKRALAITVFRYAWQRVFRLSPAKTLAARRQAAAWPGSEDLGQMNNAQQTALRALRTGQRAGRRRTARGRWPRLLRGSQTTPGGQVWLLRQLERIGRAESVQPVPHSF